MKYEMAHLSSRRSSQQEYMKLSSYRPPVQTFTLSPSYQFGDLNVMVIIKRSEQCPCQGGSCIPNQSNRS